MLVDHTKWIIVSGGVLSGLGKGIVSASIGKLLSSKYKVVPVKCDGYLNVDPGTMNPIEHGEVFVLDDGGEVDMDFGHYERFMGITCKFDWNLTTGKIFQSVIEKEREGKYLGKTVQMIPHVTNEIKEKWMKIAREEDADIMLIELGGTIGDIEMELFFEAARQLRLQVGEKNVLHCHLTLVPVLDCVGEQKTKPTQQTVALLRHRGLQPHVIIARSKHRLTEKTKEKIALFCNIKAKNAISDPDLSTVYELPLIFEKEGLLEMIIRRFGLYGVGNLEQWERLVNNIKNPKKETTVAICGKYTELQDSYVSISESLIHSGAHYNAKVNVTWVETTDIEQGKADIEDALRGVDGIIVPGGFGSRGIEGKIRVIEHCRKRNIPLLGLCYGLQLMVVEFARNVCGLETANTTEVAPDTSCPVIDILPEQREVTKKGGTMRLGAYTAILRPNTKVHDLYGRDQVSERHRHRFEVNPEHHEILSQRGLVFSGVSPDRKLVEFIELPDHKFFIGTQAHPELKSRLERPAPLFRGFVRACLN